MARDRRPVSAKAAEKIAEAFKRPRAVELLEMWIRYAGGHDKIAEGLARDWRAMEPGTQGRMRLTDALLKLWFMVDKTNPSLDDLELVEDEDLDRILEETLAQLADERRPEPPADEQPDIAA